MFPALAALQVRDTVALLSLLCSLHDTPLTSSSLDDVVTRAFELADRFTEHSQGRWAIDARKRP